MTGPGGRLSQPKHRGSGLGLPLVRQLARSHGGDAEIESTIGAGTTLRVTIHDEQ